MFDIGATELLLVAIVALVIIGPKDLPLAMRTAGRWIGQIRGMTKHFRVGIDAMIRDAEIEEQEKEWAARNEKIMREHPEGAPAEAAEGAKPASDAPVMKPLPADAAAPDQPSGVENSDEPVPDGAQPEADASPASPAKPADKGDRS